MRWRPHELPTAVATLFVNEGVVRELLTMVPIDRVQLVDEPE